MRPGESIVAGLRADAALNLIELTTGIGLLLRQLVQGVGDFTRAILLLLRLAARFQQLAADLQDLWFSASAVRPVGTWRGSSLRLLSWARRL